MRALVFGLAAGAAAVGLAWWLVSMDPAPPKTPPAAPEPAPPPPAATPAEKPAAPAAAPRRRTSDAEPAPAPSDDPPFGPGEAWLRVGEGYVFGERAARRGDAAEG